jgi:cold shock CspA family protein
VKKQGVVVRFGARGYGFIHETATAREFFVHIEDVVGRFALQAGQKVEFEEHPIHKPGKPPQAVLVQIVIDAAPVLGVDRG